MRNSTEPGARSHGDLLGGDPESVLKREADRRVERRGEAFGEGAGLVAAGFGGIRQLLVNGLDVRAQVHGATMAPSWCHVKPCEPSWRHETTSARAPSGVSHLAVRLSRVFRRT